MGSRVSRRDGVPVRLVAVDGYKKLEGYKNYRYKVSHLNRKKRGEGGAPDSLVIANEKQILHCVQDDKLIGGESLIGAGVGWAVFGGFFGRQAGWLLGWCGLLGCVADAWRLAGGAAEMQT